MIRNPNEWDKGKIQNQNCSKINFFFNVETCKAKQMLQKKSLKNMNLQNLNTHQ